MQIRVAASDTEFQGYISTPRYFEWFSKARFEFYREFGGFTLDTDGTPVMDGRRVAAVLKSTTCKFVHPGRFDDLLELTTRVSLVNGKVLTFEHTLVNLSRWRQLVAEGETSIMFLDPDTKTVVEIPEGLKGER